MSRAALVAGLVLAAIALACGAWWLQAAAAARSREAAAATGGNPDRAVPVMLAHGCAGCHTIPGVPGAHTLVGPRLDGSLVARIYIGGNLPNTPANLVRWLRFSREINPHTAMPSTHVSEPNARDVAAYLYSLP